MTLHRPQVSYEKLKSFAEELVNFSHTFRVCEMVNGSLFGSVASQF